MELLWFVKKNRVPFLAELAEFSLSLWIVSVSLKLHLLANKLFI